MTLIYNTNRLTIRENKDNAEEIVLSEHQTKIIEVLCNNCACSWKELAEYVYGYYDKPARWSLQRIKCRLLKKIKLNIKIIRKYGMILYDEILVEG